MKKKIKIFSGLKSGIKQYRETTKDMNFADKLLYIKDYYLKDALIIGVIVAVIISILVSSYINRHTDYIIFGIAVNVDLSTQGTEYIVDDFFEHHKTGGRQKVDFSCVNINNFETSDDAEASYYAAQSVVAQVGAQRLDYLFLDEVGFQFFASQEIYMDLKEILTEEEIEELSSNIVYIQEEDSEEMIMAGIKITDTPFIKDSVKAKKDIFISFAGNAPHKELAHEFLHYILEYK